MKIKIADDISRIEFFAQGEEIPKVTGGSEGRARELLIHSFRHPRLLTDNAAIAGLPSSLRDAIVRLLEFGERHIEYARLGISWSERRYPRVWAPSIDTILFAKALKKLIASDKIAKKTSSFLEIGCGSGYLSKYVLQKKAEKGLPVRHAHIMDINRDALISAMDAIEPVRGNTLVSYSLNKPQKHFSVDRTYDLIMCNPPYVPKPREKANNPFEGLFLYGEILRNAPLMMHGSSRLLINFSSLSKNDVYPTFLKMFRIRTIEKMKVPLKIPLITAGLSPESLRWMRYLLRSKRPILDPSERSGYRYWQIIEIAECKLK